MEKKPEVPSEVIEEIKLKEKPEPVKGNTSFLYDKKQFSVKIPAAIITELDWKAHEKIEVTIESADVLRLRRIKK